MRNVAVTAAILSCVALAGSALPGRAGATIPDAVERAAAFRAASLSGVLVEQRHIEFSASAGPAHFSQQNDAVVLLQDGQYKRVRYLRIVENGKTLSADQMTQRETENNNDLDRGRAFFKAPYDGRYMRDYTYNENPCTCAPHERETAFHSVVRDDQHGDGVMRIDILTGRVLTVTYTPDVLPQHASAATTVETFGEPVPGVWTVISIDRTYSGHVAFFHGNGKMTERLDHFQRFGNENAGMQYLQRAEL